MKRTWNFGAINNNQDIDDDIVSCRHTGNKIDANKGAKEREAKVTAVLVTFVTYLVCYIGAGTAAVSFREHQLCDCDVSCFNFFSFLQLFFYFNLFFFVYFYF